MLKDIRLGLWQNDTLIKSTIRKNCSYFYKKDSLRIVMNLIAHFDLVLHQMDVKTTFLNGASHEEVYMDEDFQNKGKEYMYVRSRSPYMV